jgi:lysophospholipase L1-like esterase
MVTWRQKVLLAAVSSLVCLLGLELAARSYSWWLGKGFWSRPHSFESPFFVTYDGPMPYFDGDMAVFRHGVSIPVHKPEGELRVVCLGGSTTVNVAARPEENYPRLAETRLRQKFPGRPIVVLEAGGDAFSTAHSVANLSLRLLALEPDVVTLLENVNDLTAQKFGDRLQPDYANKYLDDAFLAYEHRGGLGGAILRGSRAAQMLKWRLSVLKTTLEKSSRGGTVANPQDGRAAFRRNLLTFVAVARAHGASPVLITQSHRDGEAAAFGGEFLEYNRLVREVAASTGATLADAAPELSGKPEYFVDEVHMNAAGLAALEKRVGPAISAELARRLEQ